MYRKSRKTMTFKFCVAASIKKLYIYQHVNVLVMGSSTECPTILINCLIIFRMKSILRVNRSISMPTMTAMSIPSKLLKKAKKPNR